MFQAFRRCLNVQPFVFYHVQAAKKWFFLCTVWTYICMYLGSSTPPPGAANICSHCSQYWQAECWFDCMHVHSYYRCVSRFYSIISYRGCCYTFVFYIHKYSSKQVGKCSSLRCQIYSAVKFLNLPRFYETQVSSIYNFKTTSTLHSSN